MPVLPNLVVRGQDETEEEEPEKGEGIASWDAEFGARHPHIGEQVNLVPRPWGKPRVDE